MALPYSHTTLAQARASLIERLEDSQPATYWAVPELNFYLIEALRCWQAYTAFYRDHTTLQSAAGKSIYDLTTDLQQPGLFDYNVTNQSIYQTIQYHLLEPPTNPWTGTDQFSLDQINQALQRRRDQFLVDTGCVLTRTYPVAVPAPPISRIPLADTVIDIRRVAWVDGAGNYTPLFRDDEYAALSFVPAWVQSPTDPPSWYSPSVTPPLSIQVIPPHSNPGQIELISVSSGPTIAVAPTTTIGIPDDFAWVVKWGTLADILSADGQSTDRARAAYCELRYQQGVKLAMLNPSVLQARIADVPVQIDTIFNLDYYAGAWQSTPGIPTMIGMAGRNLLALATVPDAGPYAASFDLVRNIPVPAVDTDFLQIERPALDPLLDYAQHLAGFKLGGAEFAATQPLYDNFMQAATQVNARLSASDVYDLLMRLPALAPERVVPRKLDSRQGVLA